MLKRMSEDAKLSRVYTNHCVRATTTRILATASIQRSDIKIITGHKREASLDPYITGALGATTATKRKLSNILSEAVATADSKSRKIAISDDEELEIAMTQEANKAEEDESLVQEASTVEEDYCLNNEASVVEEDFIISQCAESVEEIITVNSRSNINPISAAERLFYNCNFHGNVTINVNIAKK